MRSRKRGKRKVPITYDFRDAYLTIDGRKVEHHGIQVTEVISHDPDAREPFARGEYVCEGTVTLDPEASAKLFAMVARMARLQNAADILAWWRLRGLPFDPKAALRCADLPLAPPRDKEPLPLP
jgi:hypothetical protein